MTTTAKAQTMAWDNTQKTKDIYFCDYNITAIAKRIFPESSVILAKGAVNSDTPVVCIYIDKNRYSQVIIDLAYDWLFVKISSPIYTEHEKIIATSILQSERELWMPDGFNQFEQE